MSGVFNKQDLELMQSRGIEAETSLEQLQLLKQGTPYVKLVRPAIPGDGIFSTPNNMHDFLMSNHFRAAQDSRMMKFVPASGAASRMFRDLSRFRVEAQSCASIGELEQNCQETDSVVLEFFPIAQEIRLFPDLAAALKKDGLRLEDRLTEGDPTSILSYLLTAKGLNYAELPKALLKFHSYLDRTRTSLEEHLVEAAQYTKDKNGICRIHFTFSPAHLEQARDLCQRSFQHTNAGLMFDTKSLSPFNLHPPTR